MQQHKRHQASHHCLQHQQNSHRSTWEQRAGVRRGWHGFLPGRGRIQLSSSNVAIPPSQTQPSRKPLGLSPAETMQAEQNTPGH